MRAVLPFCVVLIACGSSPEFGADASTDLGLDRGTPPMDTRIVREARAEAGPPPPCGRGSAREIAACADETRYMESLRGIAHARPSGSTGWQQAQDQIVTELSAAGWTAEREDYGRGVNVVARRAGTTTPMEWIVLSAHYDSVSACDGADDNASGVAGVLEAARVLAGSQYGRGIILAFWDEEEDGLLGSLAFASGWNARGLGAIRYAISLEMIGYSSDAPNSQTLPTGFNFLFPEAAAFVAEDNARGNFIAVVHDAENAIFGNALVDSAWAFGLRGTTVPAPESLLASGALADLQRSDHASFWLQRIPAAMVTDTANFRNRNYHCDEGPDAFATINPTFATRTTRSVIEATIGLLGLAP